MYEVIGILHNQSINQSINIICRKFKAQQQCIALTLCLPTKLD